MRSRRCPAARRPTSSTCRRSIVVPTNCRPTDSRPGHARCASRWPTRAACCRPRRPTASSAASGSQQPLDCVGNSFPKTHDDATGDDYWLNDSKFYVADGSLWCHGPGNAAGAARGAERRDAAGHLRHGRGAGGLAGRRARSSTTTSRRTPARRCGPTWCRSTCACRCAAPPRCSTRQQSPTLGGWVDCRNVRRTSTDGYLRRTFSTTIVLQNKLL